MAIRFYHEEEIDFPPEHRPVLPGGPARPPHPAFRRFGYGIVGILLGLTSGLSNAIVQVNSSQLLGALGAETNEISWVPTAYVMSYASMNLLLVRFRQQFGLRLYAMLSLSSFCLVTLAHTLVSGVFGAITIHAIGGFAGASLLALSIFYMMAAMKPQHSLKGAVFAFGMSQVPIPLARLAEPEELAFNHWSTLYVTEFGLAVLCLVSVAWLRLPPSQKVKAFERLDFVTYPLFACGLALLIAVIGMGRYEWWTDKAWLGWALAAAIPLLALSIYIEVHRQKPLLDVRWLYQQGLLRFGLVVILIRIVLSEQGAAAFGLLTSAGLINTNLTMFCIALVFAAVLGAIVAALVFTPTRILPMGFAGFTMIAVAALVDSYSTSLTRAPQFYLTQMTLAFATTFTIGPTLLFGLIRVLMSGGTPLASYLVMLSVAQNIGSLAGTSLLGTLEVIFEKANSVRLVERVQAFDPVVQARIRDGGGGERGVAALQAAMSHEATTLAYNNVFATVAAAAAIGAAYLLFRILWDSRHAPVPATPPGR